MMSWHRTTVDKCSKNATKMKPVTHRNATREQPVEAIVQTVTEPFLHFLKSVENPPYIRFTVPGRRIMHFFTNTLTKLELSSKPFCVRLYNKSRAVGRKPRDALYY